MPDPVWTDACDAKNIDAEGVMRFNQGGRTFAVHRVVDGTPFATEGFCTH